MKKRILTGQVPPVSGPGNLFPDASFFCRENQLGGEEFSGPQSDKEKTVCLTIATGRRLLVLWEHDILHHSEKCRQEIAQTLLSPPPE